MALRNVQEKLQEDLGIEVSHTSIGNWLEQAGVGRRPQSSGDQKNKIKRECIEIGVSTIVRFASSQSPEKLLILTSSIPLYFMEDKVNV